MRNYIILLLFVLVSCLSPYEKHVKKREAAKVKMSNILRSFPELLTIKDTTYIEKIDTHVISKDVVFRDTITIPKEIIDSTLRIEYDSIYRIQQGSLDLIVRLQKDRQLLITAVKNQQTIYYTDTVTIHDTTILTQIVKEHSEIINDDPSFWWSLWFNVRSWLWLLILVAVAYVTFKVLTKHYENR